jgi:hypothetical protein
LNKIIPESSLDDLVPKLLQKDLQKYNVIISPVREKYGRGLMSTQSFREGDKTMEVLALWYDNLKSLGHFLTLNPLYKDRVVQFSGLKSQENGIVKVYGVLVGIGQFVNHYQDLRASPNTRLEFCAGEGFNGSALKLRACTRNGAGVGFHVELVLDYGVGCVFSQLERRTEESTPKRFKGALESLFGLPKNPPAYSDVDAALVVDIATDTPVVAEPLQLDNEDVVIAENEEVPMTMAIAVEGAVGNLSDVAAASSTDPPEVPVSVILREIKEPPLRLSFCKRAKCFLLLSQSSTNKKISKDLLLYSWPQGEFMSEQSVEGRSMKWCMTPSTVVYSLDTQKLSTLSSLLKVVHTCCTSIFGYPAYYVPTEL